MHLPTANPIRSDERSDGAERLWIVLLIVGINSLGTGFGWSGIYFVASQVYGFSDLHNLWLAVTMGASYTVSAWWAARIVRSARMRLGVSSRGSIMFLLLGIGLVCTLPSVVRHEATVWLFGVMYPGLMGLLWPTVESYLSSGRKGGSLRKAVGAFNLTWAAATLLALWAMAPLMAGDASVSFAGFGGCHLLSMLLVAGLSAEPSPPAGGAGHVHNAAERAMCRALLVRFRILLLVSYMAQAALSPLLPGVMERLAVGVDWQTPLASAWMVARVTAFGGMGWWHGWHGRVRTAIWSGGCLVLGCVVIALAGSSLILVLGLVLVGVGMGVIYAAALYYALETGGVDVEAGGAHEALIGSGYAIGPVLGVGLLGILSALR